MEAGCCKHHSSLCLLDLAAVRLLGSDISAMRVFECCQSPTKCGDVSPSTSSHVTGKVLWPEEDEELLGFRGTSGILDS